MKILSIFLLVFLSASSVYDIPVNTIEGKTSKLSEYKGKVILVVNVASECGYTPQYAELQSLYEAYGEKGLVVVGFPCNDFGGQEPGGSEEIKKFCSTNYKVTFPMYEKLSMQHPLYQYLTENAPEKGAVKWNFEKFLIGKDGKVLARFRSRVKPMSEEMKKSVEAALAAK
ncbi:MAG: glutathione peroxidase [Chloroherpetonaceae bacterium]|nr:glutathione peroxidase [Chloroherpetonaceae bacterium]